MSGAIVPCGPRSPSGVELTRRSVTCVSGTAMVEAMSRRTSKIDRVTIAISLLFDGTAPKTTVNSLASGSRFRMLVTLRTACRTAAEWLRRKTMLSVSPFGLTRTPRSPAFWMRPRCSSST